jgi:hypothetical protein
MAGPALIESVLDNVRSRVLSLALATIADSR